MTGHRISGGRRLLFGAVAFVSLSLITLLLLEVGSYFYLRAAFGYDGQHLMNYEFDPYKNIRPTPNYVDTRGIQHNAQGFRRSVDTPKEKPDDTLRVFLMGGSTGYGLGSLSRFGREEYEIIPNDGTIDFYLERILEDRIPGKKVEVINAAITSFYSHHHLIYLNQTVLRYSPDVVLFLDGFNDYFNYEPNYNQWDDYGYQERAAVFLGEPSVGALAYYTGWWLFRKSHFANLAGRRLKNIGAFRAPTGQGRAQIDVKAALEQLPVNSDENWVQIVTQNGATLERLGVDAVFALQPEIAFEQSKTWSELEELIHHEMVNYWPEGYLEFKNRARPMVLDKLRAAAETSGASTLDLTDIYGDLEETAFTDYCHLTPDGNRVLAESVAPTILALLEQRVAGSLAATASSGGP